MTLVQLLLYLSPEDYLELEKNTDSAGKVFED
jgi:hypothetical protein